MPDFKKYEDELIALRREFHKYPELSLKEFETSKKIKNYLKSYGIENIREFFIIFIVFISFNFNITIIII